MARGKDAKKRFMVTVTRSVPVDAQLKSLIPQDHCSIFGGIDAQQTGFAQEFGL